MGFIYKMDGNNTKLYIPNPPLIQTDKMRRFKVKKWEIIEHDNGVTEFTDYKRALMFTPEMSLSEAEATMNAIPKYVMMHYIRLLDRGVIRLGAEEVKE